MTLEPAELIAFVRQVLIRPRSSSSRATFHRGSVTTNRHIADWGHVEDRGGDGGVVAERVDGVAVGPAWRPDALLVAHATVLAITGGSYRPAAVADRHGRSWIGQRSSQAAALDRDRALALLEQLREPNETPLGLASSQARVRALGPESAVLIYDALAASEAVQIGLIETSRGLR